MYLPQEILQHILQYITLADYRSCTLVCQDWCMAAGVILRYADYTRLSYRTCLPPCVIPLLSPDDAVKQAGFHDTLDITVDTARCIAERFNTYTQIQKFRTLSALPNDTFEVVIRATDHAWIGLLTPGARLRPCAQVMHHSFRTSWGKFEWIDGIPILRERYRAVAMLEMFGLQDSITPEMLMGDNGLVLPYHWHLPCVTQEMVDTYMKSKSHPILARVPPHTRVKFGLNPRVPKHIATRAELMAVIHIPAQKTESQPTPSRAKTVLRGATIAPGVIPLEILYGYDEAFLHDISHLLDDIDFSDDMVAANIILTQDVSDEHILHIVCTKFTLARVNAIYNNLVRSWYDINSHQKCNHTDLIPAAWRRFQWMRGLLRGKNDPPPPKVTQHI